MPVPPGVFKGVDVVERLGQQVPLDAAFRDHTGKDVTLADVVRDELPVLVTFNYSSCPQLCDLQLAGLVKALAAVRLTPGKQFRIATVILAPAEPPERAAKTRRHHVEKLRQLGGDVVGDGWTFLVSRAAASIRLYSVVRWTPSRRAAWLTLPCASFSAASM